MGGESGATHKAVLCVPGLKMMHPPRKEPSLHKDGCGLAVALVKSGRNLLVTQV